MFFVDIWFYICGQLQSCVTVCKDAFSKILVCVCFFSLAPLLHDLFRFFLSLNPRKPEMFVSSKTGANRLGDIKPKGGKFFGGGR